MVATSILTPGGSGPGNTYSIVVGREEGVDALVVVIDVDLAEVSALDFTRVGFHTDKVSVLVPDAAGRTSQLGVTDGKDERYLHVGKMTTCFPKTPGAIKTHGNLEG